MNLTAENLDAIAGRIAKELTYDDRPRIGEKEVEGSTVRKRDRIRMVFSDDPVMGDMSSYGVRISNPNRGTTYFGINDEEDLDKLEASFRSALDKVRAELKAHRSAIHEFFEAIRRQRGEE